MACNYQYAGPEIVSDGLVLYLNAASPNSYNLSTPTIFRDISRKGNNGTLVNSPTYNSLNSGSFVYNGSNNYTQVNSAISSVNSFTVCVWFYPTSYGSNGNVLDCNNVNNVGPRLEMDSGTLAWVYSSSTNNSMFYGRYVKNTGLLLNTWHHTCITYNSLLGDSGTSKSYYNGINTGFSTSAYGGVTGKFVGYINNMTIGRGFNGPIRYFPGRISQTMIYNRALSDSEILKNFNATKSRYGI